MMDQRPFYSQDLPTSEGLVDHCLRRIGETDIELQAWRSVLHHEARQTAERCDDAMSQGQIHGPLHGVPVGIKDIIDIAGQQTLCNSKARSDRKPETADAWIVNALKQNGAIVLGKTHTTEFASFDPAPTRNPHSPDHTPGGSSSGSAAAVASGQVPLAIGTQTVASVNRPAAYCGTFAFKPTPGLWPMNGIVPFASSFDTLGIFATGVTELAIAGHAIGLNHTAKKVPFPRSKIHVVDDPLLELLKPEDHAAFEDVLTSFSEKGIAAERAPSPIPLEKVNTLQSLMVAYEASRTHRYLFETHADQLGPKFRAVIEEGLELDEGTYLDARRQISEIKRNFFAAFPSDAVFLWPATPEPAPSGLQSTGDPRFIQPWTVLGVPTLSVPYAPLTSQALPRGVIFASFPFSDSALLDWAGTNLSSFRRPGSQT